jgi:hypothetical protein
MEMLYAFTNTGENSLRAVGDIITVLPFLMAVLLATLTPLKNIRKICTDKNLYPFFRYGKELA